MKFSKENLNSVRGKNDKATDKETKTLSAKSLDDHYIADRAIYDEIYGRTQKHIKHHWVVHYVMLALLFVLVVGLIIIGSQSKTEVAVVKIDANHNIISIDPAHKVDLPSAIPNATVYFMHRFIEDARSVSFDYAVQSLFQRKAFAFTEGNASKTLSDFFIERSDLVANREQVIEVAFENALPNLGGSSETIQMRWVETTKDIKTGDVLTQKRFTGQFSYELTGIPPTDSEILIMNPLGFYIRHISWAEDFSYVS